MNLKWNPTERRFEAEFSDFASEQPLVKSVGFKTDGPPAWVWYSYKSEPLTKLRENKPAVLTISPEARAEYNRLHEVELRNATIKAQMKEAAKQLKKTLKRQKQDAMKPDEFFDEELQIVCNKVAPKPPIPVASLEKIRTDLSTGKCIICGDNLYDYEYSPEGPKACFWCQKIVLDNTTEVC